MNSYFSAFIKIERQHNWHIIQSKYQSYLVIFLQFFSIIIVNFYLQFFILPYLIFILLKNKYSIYNQHLSKLAILKARDQIHTYIQFENQSNWHNSEYIYGYSFLNYNLMIISVKYQNKNYTYFILKYGMPKILFENLRKKVHYLMFYSQIKKYNIKT